MKCSYCGYEIPEGKFSCDRCGKEVFYVPDYNPLDDMLAEQVKVSVNGNGEANGLDFSQNMRNHGSSRRTTANTRNTSPRRDTGRRPSRNTSGRPVSERERKRRQAEKRKAIRKRKRNRRIGIAAVLLVLIAVAAFFLYQNSYTGVLNKGYKALEAKDYSTAADHFNRAISKNAERAEAYAGLARVYSGQKEPEKGQELFAQAVKNYPKNAEIYEAYVLYLQDEKLVMEIPLLLDEADNSVKEALQEYIVEVPEFDLDEEEVYDDVQQLTLSADGMDIYFTTDERDPSPDGERFTEPIQLDEGENVIKAIAVNKDGIPSMIVEKTYVIEFPTIDAPAISPSTGQYESAQKIEIKVPDGYEAYYTMDGEDPTTASKKYDGPIDMPEGETLFKAILVNAKGRVSDITTRNYQLYSTSGDNSGDTSGGDTGNE